MFILVRSFQHLLFQYRDAVNHGEGVLGSSHRGIVDLGHLSKSHICSWHSIQMPTTHGEGVLSRNFN